MPLNDNLKIKNANSLIRQKATRSRRDADRKVNDRRKDLLQSATSASERRKIKSGVYDLDTTRTDDNKQGTDERIQNDGIDKLYSPAPSSSGGGGGGETFTLDVVKDDNTAGTATFNGSGVN